MSSWRMAYGGARIDRNTPLTFEWNGKKMTGFTGDTLASALLANRAQLVGRSFKYHRPRGLLAAGSDEPNALVGITHGGNGNGRFTPNERATRVQLADGMQVESQNHWPSLEFDVGAMAQYAAKLLPAGFYYKTFMWPRAAWKHLYEPFIRSAAGLGKAPTEADPDRYQHYYYHTDLVVAGGGIAGLEAALEAGRAGQKVLLAEQTPHLGGRALADSEDGAARIAALSEALAALPNVTIRTGLTVQAVEDHGYVLASEDLAQAGPRTRLWRIRTGSVIAANGAFERPLVFAGNDTPGVMLASAVRDYLAHYAVVAGERTVVVTNNDDAYRTALALVRAGAKVPLLLDARPSAQGPLIDAARAAGIEIRHGWGVSEARGGKSLRAVRIAPIDSSGLASEEIACDCLAVSGGWSAAVHLFSQPGGKLIWDVPSAQFLPDPDRPPRNHDGTALVRCVGAAAGAEATPVMPVWQMPLRADKRLKSRAFVDLQNDVKASDIALAAQEGFVSVEHAKRYTTLGMATDQGKTSNINGLAALADATGRAIPQVGTTTFRPPFEPLTLGAIAGAAKGPLFKPTRRTVIDPWLDQRGAHWEPVGDWRRPFAIVNGGESLDEAITREIQTARNAVTLLDASTLGKILVQGPDAAAFLDMLYSNVMSTLKPGRCRYGLMLNEGGFVFDDGVVARLGPDSFLCHTTSGGSDNVHGWMEEWLQTEWPHLQVYTQNVTEAYAQIAVAGPKARKLLDKLGGIDLGADALPFMGWCDGTLGGIPARVLRVSFTGELSFEIAVRADRGLELWTMLMKAGAEFGIAPHGTEALHVLRAEKGFIIVGDETDGTVTPHDLGMSWIVSKKKADFIGKRGLMRADLTRPGRKQLVGLETEDPAVVLPDGSHAIENGTAIGHVTSSYHSPSLGRSIAMALIEDGLGRMGETLDFDTGRGTVRARLRDVQFFDPEGARQNV